MSETAVDAMRGVALLENPVTNQGTAFDLGERRRLGLDGLLPPVVETLEQQADRAYAIFRTYREDAGRHVYLRGVQDTNETLFYKLVVDHVEEMLPVVYTPTVGWATQHFSNIYRRNRGLFLSYPYKERLRELLANRPHPEVDVMVVTDGERVLGLGDQGAGGLAISIGKLSLYSAIGGVHPARTLPVVLDVGTDNDERLEDPAYIGWRHGRVDDDEYDDFVERFVEAVEAELPGVLVQWEDFATRHARPILERYRDRLLTFNDDIQGTAGVVAGALAGAVDASGSTMRDQRVVFLGAGSAAVGVAACLRAQLLAAGLDADEARERILLVDRRGLLTDDRTDLDGAQRGLAQPAEEVSGWRSEAGRGPGLAEVVEQFQPTILIGLSSAAGAFTEPIVRQMAAKVDRPIILPLSNPTSRSEADPADLVRWTDGRVLTATGSPFPPVEVGGRQVPIAQANNVYIFPAIGLGVIASRASRVTDRMILAAAGALGERSPARRSATEPPLPPVSELRTTARSVAVAVARAAVEEGVAPRVDDDELVERVARSQWAPAYGPGDEARGGTHSAARRRARRRHATTTRDT